MRILLLSFIILLTATVSNAQKRHCIYIGTNTGEFQPRGTYIIVIGNFKPDMVFKDSSVNIDMKFCYWHTPRGKILLSYIRNNYNSMNAIEFNNNLQVLIKKYYLNHMALYIRNRRHNRIFYTFN